MEELIIGSHVSFTKEKQLVGSVLECLSYNANTFMFYTGAPQNTVRSVLRQNLTEEAYRLMEEHQINPANVVIHAPYIVNLANNQKKDSYQFAIEFLDREIERCEELGILRMILHPGSYVQLSKEEGITNIVNALDTIMHREQAVFICLETMAGKGTEIGSLDDIAEIIARVKYPEKIMVCLDTCHLSDAGYDMSNFDQFLEEFDRKIGISKIGCIHINDSKNVRGAHKDRHANLGFGTLGFDNLLQIIYHPQLKNVPKILETPYVTKQDDLKERVYPPYRFEIEMIRQKKFDPLLIEKIRAYYK